MRPLWVAYLILATLVSAWQGAAAAGDIREQPVHFHAGASSATLSGRIKGYEAVDYRLGAKAGQTMNVTMQTDSDANYFNVLPPGSDAAIGRGDNTGNAWTGTLPVDGTYTLSLIHI